MITAIVIDGHAHGVIVHIESEGDPGPQCTWTCGSADPAVDELARR